MTRLNLKEAVVVEGKYDKIKLSSFIDSLIITTEGFSIFKDAEKKAYIKKLAEERGIIILTDSDSAGFLIRNHLKSFIDEKYIFNAYIPQLEGKEKRKQEKSKEGLLGVEGLSTEIIREAIQRSGVKLEGESLERKHVYTNTDLFNLGISGGANAKEKKLNLLKQLKLPSHMSTSALLKYLNTIDENEVAEALELINK